MKRFIDVFMSSIGILFLSPIFIIVSIIVKKKIGKPIIFKQIRAGKNGYPFYLYKFRTMSNEKDEKGKLLPNHLRMNTTGKKLRELSLDELPQLINVLKGDMSLVGPRPLYMDYVPLYNEEQRKRMNVKPGITGWAQVNGRNSLSWEEKFDLDVWYVENKNISLDIYILYLTVMKVLKSENINLNETTTMNRFEGDN